MFETHHAPQVSSQEFRLKGLTLLNYSVNISKTHDL